MQRSLRVVINTLPDDVLLEIFKFYVDSHQIYLKDTWHTLAHVCRKWRYVVFASPRWLRLELRCTNRTPAKKMLDIWPALPIVIDAYITTSTSRRSGVTNIVAALKRHDLVCRINIWGVPNSLLKSAAMKKRFPQLTDLTLRSNKEDAPVITDSFLGGSAPRLRSLEFRGISFPFPALGKLFSSAKDLVTLRLLDIPKSGSISPEQIVTSLSALTRLQELFIDFRSPRSHADRERRHQLLKRLVLPSLTEFYFKGDCEYLEDIVGRMDAPVLDMVTITFFNQLVFNTPLLRDFFSRSVFQEPHRADVTFHEPCINLTFFRREGTTDRRMLSVGISSSVLEWQISSLAQFCSTCLPLLPTLECLVMHRLGSRPEISDDMDIAPWSELLHSFVTVKDLVLSHDLIQFTLHILRRITGEGVPEVLPALRHVLGRFSETWSGPVYARVQEVTTEFVTTRQLSGRPVVLNPVGTLW